MNFKTTLVLLVLAAAAGLLLVFDPPLPPPFKAPPPAAVSAAGTAEDLEHLKPDALSRIEVRKGDRVVLLERKGGDWSMPGNWPTRQAEVRELVDLLGNLHSRFEPEPLAGEAGLRAKGLLPPAVTVKVETDKHKHTLAFGEGPAGENNRFSRPTYLRVDDRPETLRLGPGLVAALDRPVDYYQQRRLFPYERVAGEDNPQTRVERLAGRALTVSEKKPGGLHYTLARDPGDWELSEPRDRLDPRARDNLLAAVPDLWAERFVRAGDPAAAGAAAGAPGFWLTRKGLLLRSGLDDPERTLVVTRPDGEAITLLVGKVARVQVRKEPRPTPPGMPPGLPAGDNLVHEEYRYAKLQNNDQVFEIKADKLKDVFVALDTLRDAQVARFSTADARRLEVTHAGQQIVLAKEKDRWRLVKPIEADADESKVTELLSKLSGLEARDKDVLDKADPKAYGLDKPGTTIKVEVEEKKKGQEPKARTLTLRLGKHDAAAKKVYVQADDWPRINAVDDGLEPLATRPALAYRGKRVLDFTSGDLARIDITRDGKKLALEQGPEGWRLAAPVAAEADTSKVGQLADALGRLEAAEYVNDAPKPAELGKEYGLDRPVLTVTLTFKDKTKPARTLQLGKARAGKPGYFARLADAPAVFAVNNDLHAQLDHDSLDYRPLNLWQVSSEDITGLRVHKPGQDEYRLTRAGAGWQVGGPFTAAALPATVQKMTEPLAAPRCERYKVHEAKDLKPYGLDEQHALKVTLSAKSGEHTLLIGKPADDGTPGRYAKLAKGPAVFVVNEDLVKAVDHTALDVLDPVLVRLDPGRLERIEWRAGGVNPPVGSHLKLERKGEEWRVLDAPGSPFPADAEAVAALRNAWSPLQAERFAAYGKIDAAKYGLDRPAVTVTVYLHPPGEKGAPARHTLELGGEVPGEKGARYARLDNRAGVAVLSPGQVQALSQNYLDFVNRTVLKLDAGAVTLLQRHMGPDVLELARKDDAWHLTRPADMPADDKAMQELLDRLSSLRAQRIAAYPAKELDPYGLDKPAAVLTVKLTGGAQPAEHLIKVGKVADEATGARFAVVDGGPAVAVLPGPVVRRLVAAPLAFRDRSLARFADADRIDLEQGPRKAVFARVEGSWKLVEPIKVDAEQDKVEDLINTLARLRADELVAERPAAADLKKYGLDRPEARWRLQSGGKEVLSLAVGKQEKDGPRRYARLAGRDLVFLLDPRLSARAVGELRPRTVWTTPLDAIQIEALRFDHVKNPFVLEKGEGDSWRVAGKPGAKVNAETVKETLAALANLQLARYAVDRDTDLKLFGLEPPALTLEVVTRSGKRVLQIGNPEGESKRRYARLADADRPGVFVLDEAAVTNLFRDLAAFTRPPRTPTSPPASGPRALP